MSYNNALVVEKFRDKWSVSPNEAEELFDETKKFLYVAHVGHSKGFDFDIFESTVLIDEMWHSFILCTTDYRDFCQKHFGRLLHHRPFSKSDLDGKLVAAPPSGESHRKVMLDIGNLLYVPMGHWNRVPTETSYSLHVSFVLDFPRRYDVLERLKLELQKDEYFRRPEFIGVQRGMGDTTELKQRLVRAVENWSMPLPSHSATNREPPFNLGQLNAKKTS